jgi:hypothetical protein
MIRRLLSDFRIKGRVIGFPQRAISGPRRLDPALHATLGWCAGRGGVLRGPARAGLNSKK